MAGGSGSRAADRTALIEDLTCSVGSAEISVLWKYSHLLKTFGNFHLKLCWKIFPFVFHTWIKLAWWNSRLEFWGKVRDWIANGGATGVAYTCFPSLPLSLHSNTSHQNVNCSGCKSICLWATTWAHTGFNLLLMVLLRLLRNMLNNFINRTKHILAWDKVRARNRLTWNLKVAKSIPTVSTNGKRFNRNKTDNVISHFF